MVSGVNHAVAVNVKTLGQKIEKNGLLCPEIYHVVDGKKTETTDIILDKVLKIYFSNTKGLTEENGKVYPGLSIEVLSPENEQVLYSENALVNFSEKGLPVAFSKKISATIGVASPMKVGKTYTVKTRLWDIKGAGEVIYTTKVAITGKSTREKLLTGKIISSGLTAKNVMLLKDKKVVRYDLLTVGDTAIIGLMGVGEFEKGKDGLYSIEMDINVADSSGSIVKQVEGMLKESGHISMKSNTTNLSATIDTKGYKPGKYTATIVVHDKINGNKVNITKSFGLINLNSRKP